MKEYRRILNKFDFKIFKSYFLISILFILVIIGISKIGFTSAKYESHKDADLTPNFAFFITDVGVQSENITLDNIIPSSEPYVYVFTVSNFKDSKKSNVDLKYSIEVITTTNLPLDIKLYKNPDFTEGKHTDTITGNSDGVYFRHLLYNSEMVMNYSQAITDTYTLKINFPISYKNDYSNVSGVMELIDIEIVAKQVVDV